MIYKKYELSLSLNGESLMHIARNAAGIVVFRESSEKELKRAIDDYIKDQQYQEELAEQKKLEKEDKQSLTSLKRSLPSDDGKKGKAPEEIIEEQVLVPEKRVTRGPDGKFISKSQLDLEEIDKKKTFWDKLTS